MMRLTKDPVAKIEQLALEAQSARVNRQRVDLGPLRAALIEACSELGVDARRPGVPRSGSLLDAAAERLGLTGWQKARADYDARWATAEADERERAETRAELKELELAYARTRAAAVDAGKGKVPLPTRTEEETVSRLLARQHLQNAAIPFQHRVGNWHDLAHAAVAPDEWPHVLLIGGAIRSRLQQEVDADFAEGRRYDALLNGRNRSMQDAWRALRAYAVRGAGCRDHPEQADRCDAVCWAWDEVGPLQRSTPRDASAELAAEAEAELVTEAGGAA